MVLQMVFETRKHTNLKRDARYRRIRKYTKSRQKWLGEQQRRKEALRLQDQGLLTKDIAVRLGVSRRTVQRIFAGCRPYIERNRKRFAGVESKDALSRLGQASGGANKTKLPLSIKKQLELISELDNRWSQNRRVLICKDLTLTIDVEAAINGKYAVKFKPKLPVDMLQNGRITVELRIFGKSQPIARIYVAEANNHDLILDTNQSMNTLVEPVLTSLKSIYDDAKKASQVGDGETANLNKWKKGNLRVTSQLEGAFKSHPQLLG